MQYRGTTEFLNQVRERYGRHREAFEKAAFEWTNERDRWNDELRRGWRDIDEEREATEAHREKMAILRRNLESVERNAKADYDKIRAEAAEIFAPFCRPNPEQYDAAAHRLIDSGIYSDKELEDLGQCYARERNIAMLRLVSKAAEQRAENGKNPKMHNLAVFCREAQFQYLEPIDGLIFYAESALRTEPEREDKSNAILKANGVAQIFDGEADKICKAAAEKRLFIGTKTVGDDDFADGDTNVE